LLNRKVESKKSLIGAENKSLNYSVLLLLSNYSSLLKIIIIIIIYNFRTVWFVDRLKLVQDLLIKHLTTEFCLYESINNTFLYASTTNESCCQLLLCILSLNLIAQLLFCYLQVVINNRVVYNKGVIIFKVLCLNSFIRPICYCV